MRVYLQRHTAVAVPEGTCYGQSDVALADTWREDFAAVRAKLPLAALRADLVYSSPLQRCAKLATWLRDKITLDERLMELNFGDWDGQYWGSIPRDEIRAWRDDHATYAVRGGESYADLYQRAGEFWQELVQGKAETVLIVTHAGIKLVLLARLLELEAQQVFRLKLDYGGLSQVLIDGEWIKIEYINR